MQVQSLDWEDSSWGGNGNPLQYSCLGNPMKRGAWWATVQGVTEELDIATKQHFLEYIWFTNIWPREHLMNILSPTELKANLGRGSGETGLFLTWWVMMCWRRMSKPRVRRRERHSLNWNSTLFARNCCMTDMVALEGRTLFCSNFSGFYSQILTRTSVQLRWILC